MAWNGADNNGGYYNSSYQDYGGYQNGNQAGGADSYSQGAAYSSYSGYQAQAQAQAPAAYQEPAAAPEPVFGDEVWEDDDEVRTMSGTKYAPWKTWDECTGDWKLPAGLMSFLCDAGFRCPTPIQAHTWPVLMDGKDVIGVAKTGSGKTLGYLLPGYVKVKRLEQQGYTFDSRTGPAMLVVAPTRELCLQISEESTRFGNPAGINTACVYGGAPKQQQQRELWSGPQCIAATPGRLNDFLQSNVIKLGQCSYFVLDEADRMLDMGFQPQVMDMLKYLPQQRQTAFFTATWPREVRDMARTVCDISSTTHIQVGSSEQTSNRDITQHVKVVNSEREKMEFLQREIFPMLIGSNGSALIFCKTKRTCTQLYQSLSGAGAPIVQLQGDMEQRDRDWALKSFKEGKAKVLVATDVAQRGLDIKNVQFVINYDPAPTLEDYTHRIGRTGRAGTKGDAFTLLLPSDTGPAKHVNDAMRKTAQPVPQELKSLLGGGGGGGWGGYGSKYGANLDAGWGNFRG